MQTNDESTRMESVSLSQKFAEIDGRRPRVSLNLKMMAAMKKEKWPLPYWLTQAGMSM